ncbi:MAG: flagellar export chaperone FliS [Thiotrichales bacterium]
MMNPYATAANAYKQVGNYSNALAADPHKLVDMLYAGALEKIARAKGHLARHEIAAKGRCITQAIDIVVELKAGLRPAGGEISQNLEALYDYMQRRLFEANRTSDVALLDEVAGLIEGLRGAWNNIPQDQRVKQDAAA